MLHKLIVKKTTRTLDETLTETMGREFVLLALMLAFVSCFFSLRLEGQTSQGSITGRVTDSSGAIVRHAAVQIISDDTQAALSTVTNSDGLYNIQSLNPGAYTVKVSGE